MDKTISAANSQGAMAGLSAAQGILGLWQSGMASELAASTGKTQVAWTEANTEVRVAGMEEAALIRYRQLEAIIGNAEASHAGRGLRAAPIRSQEASLGEFARDIGITQKQIKLIRLGAEGEKAGIRAGAATQGANALIRGFGAVMSSYTDLYMLNKLSVPGDRHKVGTQADMPVGWSQPQNVSLRPELA